MFKLEIETDNDAFADGKAGPELARILRDTAERVGADGGIDPGGIAFTLHDANGNMVGLATFSPE